MVSARLALSRLHNVSSSSRWVCFGGSYAGSLAAWARLKVPGPLWADTGGGVDSGSPSQGTGTPSPPRRALHSRLRRARCTGRGARLGPSEASEHRAEDRGPSPARLTASPAPPPPPQFPHLLFAAVASSAPVRAVLDFSAYNEVRTRAGPGGSRVSASGSLMRLFSSGGRTTGGVQEPHEHGDRRVPGSRSGPDPGGWSGGGLQIGARGESAASSAPGSGEVGPPEMLGP